MIEIIKTDDFDRWLRQLRDTRARARVMVRLDRVALGNLGDAKFFDGIGELRINYGPGLRVYFLPRGAQLIVLLGGGDKSTQAADIQAARALARHWQPQENK